MKKHLIILAMAATVLCTTSAAQAIVSETILTNHRLLFHEWDYISAIDFGTRGFSDGFWIGTGSFDDVDLNPSLRWRHTLPADLHVPPGHVDKALLFIDAYKVDERNNLVHVQGALDFKLNRWDWLLDNSLFVIESDAPEFWNQGYLQAGIEAHERALRVDAAIFMMDYSTDQNPIPEPGTLALLGLGLVAVGAIRLRRKG
jgi:hypothetical protein